MNIEKYDDRRKLIMKWKEERKKERKKKERKKEERKRKKERKKEDNVYSVPIGHKKERRNTITEGR